MEVKNKIICSSCYDAHISCADDCLGSIQGKGTVKTLCQIALVKSKSVQ